MGWVCPLGIEQAAALMMLDEEHERLATPEKDGNIYHLGSINEHNVVLVSPPRPGNLPTAAVVINMKRTFTKLKFGLLVGIGGGVPRTTASDPIRLGDVVVGIPTGTHSGVVQYDHGKSTANGEFVRIGCLPSPPETLLEAVTALEARRRTGSDPVLETVQNTMNRDKGGIFRFPGPEHDHLYHPGYIHQREGQPCYGEAGACDPKQRIERPIVEAVSSIVVHTGTIASGEIVMKNAKQRDDIAQKYNVLCFEMEAAGAIANFPCLVIRGISDYCDSHKNDMWHGYAAASAAAYAKQLFFVLHKDEAEELEHERSRSHSSPQGRNDRGLSNYFLAFCSMLENGLHLCSLGNQIQNDSKPAEREETVKYCVESWNTSRDRLHHAMMSSLGAGTEGDLCSKLQTAVAEIQKTSQTLNDKFGQLHDRANPNEKNTFHKLQEQLQGYRDQLIPLIVQFVFPNDYLLNERMKDGFEQASTSVAGAVYSRLGRESAKYVPEDEKGMARSFGRCVFGYDKMVVESLNFDILHHREDDISTSQEETLKWLLRDPTEEATPYNNVRLFLRSELSQNEVAENPPKSIFYINGKAGSGKSTSMKTLCNNDNVSKDIETWAGDSHVLVSRFYFWYRGTNLQKSQRGLLRALLYQCLSKKRLLIPLAVPRDAELDTPTKARQYWSLTNLRRAFNQMLKHEGIEMNLKFCFFIDGLDEYAADADIDHSDGSHASIGDLLMEMARHPHVKICVSSRPEPPFETLFEGCPGFKLQERTTEDIRSYVKSRLGKVRTLQESHQVNIEKSLIENAEGVFLWVRLATDSLLESISEHASPNRWMEILNELPRGLENFYMHMLTKADKDNQGEGLGYLLLVKAADGNIPLQRLAYAAACDAKSKGSFKSICGLPVKFSEILKKRIQVCCKGLLEIGVGNDVSFLHKSVADFLETSKLTEKRAAREVNWMAEHQLLDGYVLMLETVWPKNKIPRTGRFIIDPICHKNWVGQLKPILDAYVKTAQRALRLGEPVPIEKVTELYNAANDRWIYVKNKKAAEIDGTLHWSMASSQNIDSEDLRGRIKKITKVNEYMQYWRLGPRERPQSSTEGETKFVATLEMQHGGKLSPAKVYAGQNADKYLRITKLAATTDEPPATNSETTGNQAYSNPMKAKEQERHMSEHHMSEHHMSEHHMSEHPASVSSKLPSTSVSNESLVAQESGSGTVEQEQNKARFLQTMDSDNAIAKNTIKCAAGESSEMVKLGTVSAPKTSRRRKRSRSIHPPVEPATCDKNSDQGDMRTKIRSIRKESFNPVSPSSSSGPLVLSTESSNRQLERREKERETKIKWHKEKCVRPDLKTDNKRGNINREIGSALEKPFTPVLPYSSSESFWLSIGNDDPGQERPEPQKETNTKGQKEKNVRSGNTLGRIRLAPAPSFISTSPSSSMECVISRTEMDEEQERAELQKETSTEGQEQEYAKSDPDTEMNAREVKVGSLQNRPGSSRPTKKIHRVRGLDHRQAHARSKAASDEELLRGRRQRHSTTSRDREKPSSKKLDSPQSSRGLDQRPRSDGRYSDSDFLSRHTIGRASPGVVRRDESGRLPRRVSDEVDDRGIASLATSYLQISDFWRRVWRRVGRFIGG